ncbi:lipopolysaccharide assembly protein LapB [Psychrobacter sp. M13]|uniref:tetratricopeptide repeat protein n=1 Tax=Psychrobacter sp. M13 TaxID=3067275 RepID=UPI00273CE319|nr:tetratricopeptide repeat protein [Psychrobacter sp. M13]WLP93553.1 tetratricopeptide repeat protein [Psychrobacter sp. M13]
MRRIKCMHRINCPIGLALILSIASLPLYAAPFTPANDQQILAILPTNAAPPLYSNAQSFSTSTKPLNNMQTEQLLERAYLQGDPRALGQAQAHLDQTTNQDTATLMLKARALQSDHKFDKAKDTLEQILAKEPNNPDALLTLSSLLVVEGQYKPAMEHCKKLNDSSLQVYQLACMAQIQTMTGQLEQAKQTLNALASIASGLDPSTARWIYLIQADAALRSRDTDLAEQVFRVMDSDTVPALMAQADWLLKTGQYSQARQLLQDHTDKDALLLRLITAQLKLKDPKAQQNLALMKERMEVLQLREESAHIREQATYALLTNQLDSALELARANWQQQRETADIILYATAAIKTGSDKDIEVIQQFITDNNYEYPALERDLRLGKISGCLDCQTSDIQASSRSAYRSDFFIHDSLSSLLNLKALGTTNAMNAVDRLGTINPINTVRAVSPLSIKEIPL